MLILKIIQFEFIYITEQVSIRNGPILNIFEFEIDQLLRIMLRCNI